MIRLVSVVLAICLAGNAIGEDKRDPTVGAEGLVQQIILTGTELVGKPITEGTPLVVRVTNVFPHGDSYRYDLQFHGLEPGSYNLAEFLQRKDGSAAENLPEINVRVRSLLPPGQIEPNPLAEGWLPRMGGYRVVATVAVLFWIGVLFGLIFLGHKKKAVEQNNESIVSLADLLRPRMVDAIENKMQPQQYAELERMLFAFWRQELNLESESPEIALAKIHDNPDAGPLMKQLEQWMHNPDRVNDIDLSRLLKPYQDLPADSVEIDL